MTSEVFVVDGILNFKKSFLGQNWCHVIYTHQHNNQFLPIMLLSSKSPFFLNAKQRLVPYGISIRRDLYFNYYKEY